MDRECITPKQLREFGEILLDTIFSAADSLLEIEDNGIIINTRAALQEHFRQGLKGLQQWENRQYPL